MKKAIFYISLLFFVTLVLASCHSRKPHEPVIIEKTKEVRTIVKDTIYKIDADSSYYHAYIDCVNGKPIIRESVNYNINVPKSKSGNKLDVPKVTLNGNLLNVECHKQAEELFKTWRETYVKEHVQKPVLVPTPVQVEKPLSWWVKTQMWLGRIFLGFLTLFIVLIIFRLKNKI